jgi:alkanesulfonate monooxygenase SsuD/methylene tetrahydromethanopterin reductase-like flavin-dependent oxidoreductase (luciferase family)
VSWDTETVEAFDTMAQTVAPEQVAKVVNVSSDPSRHLGWLQEYVEQGWDQIYLHHVGQDQRGFIDAFGEHVLPRLDPRPPAPATTDRPAVEHEEATR